MIKKKLQKKIEEAAKIVAFNLMNIRITKGISLYRASTDLGISQCRLYNIERGKYQRVKIVQLYLLAVYYQVELPDLFKGM